MENVLICPVCGKSKFTNFLQVTDNVVSHETFTIDSCYGCGFIFLNPRPDENQIGRYYESEEYIYHSNKKSGLFLKVFHLARGLALKKKLKLINGINKNASTRSILDFGCGTGEFLNVCKKDGWIVTGIETSKAAREYAKSSFGLNVNDLDSFSSLPFESFDIITLWHVLEHVHKLNETLSQLKKLLKPGGVLLIAVPNSSSPDAKYYGRYWAAYDPPRHLYHFVPSSMKKLIEGQEMKIKRLHRMPLDAFYVSLLSERFKTGKMRFIGGLNMGFWSFLKSVRNPELCSSVLYEIIK